MNSPFPINLNAHRHRPILQRWDRITGLSLPEDGSSCNHRKRRAATRIIPKRRRLHLIPTGVNPAHPKPAVTARPLRRRPNHNRNTTNRHHRRPRHRLQDRRDKIRTKTVPAMVRVAVRDIDWSPVLFVKRRGAWFRRGVFAFATSLPLAKSAREHHAAAI